MSMDLPLNHVPQCVMEQTLQHDKHRLPDNHQAMSISPPFIQSNMFLTGYTDCAQEALWYLTEVENLPQNHPSVVGLKMHLYEQYRMLQIQHLLRNALYMCNEEEAEVDYVKASNDSVMTDDTLDCVTTNRAINTDAKPKCENTDITHEPLQVDGICEGHTKNNIRNFTKEKSSSNEAVEGVGNEKESELSPDAHMVAVALAEEIYALLQSRKEEQNEEVDYSTDTDSDVIDEGFDELVEP